MAACRSSTICYWPSWLLAAQTMRILRWSWSVGDLVVWDDRATLHRAVDDYGDQPRVLRRSTIWGEAPVSVDGRRSVPVINGVERAKAN